MSGRASTRTSTWWRLRGGCSFPGSGGLAAESDQTLRPPLPGDATGLELVRMDRVSADQSEFELVHEPGHPAANAEGYVKYPNVNTLIELMDMREAQRSYEANLNMVESSRAMMQRALDLLRR